MPQKTPRLRTPDAAPSLAWVSAKDYARHWGEDGQPLPAPRYAGEERRVAGSDRRAAGHERRWDASRGRRFSQRRQRFKQPALPFD